MHDSAESESEPGEPRPLPAFLFAVLSLVIAAAAASAADAPPFLEIEKKMFELVNQARAEHQKKAYEYDDELAAVARAHSRDMLENNFFAHESPRTGKVAQRLAAAKVRVMVAGENISMNRSVEVSHERLLKSPGHRKNLLRDVYTHCGIGILRASNGLYYITEVFAAPAPRIDLRKAVPDLLATLNRARIARGTLPFQISPALNRIAAQHAARVAKAGKQIPADLGAQALDAGVKHRRLSTACLVTWNPEELTQAAALLEPKVGRIGLGLAENTDHERLGLGILWAIVVFTHD